MEKPQPYKNAGFTLLELSIVLVIIGIIIGGIFVGQDLIKAAQVLFEISQITKIETAVNTFKNKYNCVPGDCPIAANFSMGPNGNGDGVISQFLWNPVNSTFWYESVYVWQHLGNAGLIWGNYDGNSNCALTLVCGSTTAPQSRLNFADSLFMAGNMHVINQYVAVPIYGNNLTKSDTNIGIFWFNSKGTTTANFNVYDAFDLDTKIDDGIADTGRFITVNDFFAANGCITGDSQVTNGTANYNMTDLDNDCFPIYILP